MGDTVRDRGDVKMELEASSKYSAVNSSRGLGKTSISIGDGSALQHETLVTIERTIVTVTLTLRIPRIYQAMFAVFKLEFLFEYQTKFMLLAR